MAKITKCIIDFNSGDIHTYYTEDALAPSGIVRVDGCSLLKDNEGPLTGAWGDAELESALAEVLGVSCEIAEKTLPFPTPNPREVGEFVPTKTPSQPTATKE